MGWARLLLTAAFALGMTDRQVPVRQVAVTFDDLPVVSILPLTDADRAAITHDLLAAIARHHVPAVGFVNEDKLGGTPGHPVRARVALLTQWLDAGLELGNHTWSHLDLHAVPLERFEQEVLAGDTTTRALLAERGRVPHWFRHPYLHTGRSLEVRDSVTAFLAAHGYRVAPVTLDNRDSLFAAAYARARAAGDSAAATRVREAFLGYVDSVLTFYENQAELIVGRPIPQVLLLHANRLNAATFDTVASHFEARGYTFVDLATAVADSAYALPDHYTGPGGITWLHRWALTKGMPRSTYRGEPEVPEWVAKLGAGEY